MKLSALSHLPHLISIYCSFELNYYNLREITVISVIPTVSVTRPEGGGGRGGLPYKSDGNARRKIKIEPLRETNVGVAQA